MSTTAVPLRAPATARTDAARGGPHLARVAAAEWGKLTSLRSTAAVAAATVVVSALVTHLSASASSTDPGFEPLRSLTTGVPLAQVGTLVLGILVGAGEFSTGTFRSTFAAVPRRLPVLAAQLVAVTGLLLVVSALTVAAAVLALLPAAGSRGMTLDVTGGQTPQVLAGTVGVLVGLGLVGFAFGALLRRPVPAVVVAVVLVLVLPVALALATDPGLTGPAPSGPSAEPGVTAVGTVLVALPGVAAMFLVPGEASFDGAPDLGVAGGAAVLAAWVLVPLALAAARLRTRDLG